MTCLVKLFDRKLKFFQKFAKMDHFWHFLLSTSEASYLYILSGQKFLKKAQNGQFGDFLKTKAYGHTASPDSSILIGQKLVENAKIKRIKTRHFE